MLRSPTKVRRRPGLRLILGCVLVLAASCAATVVFAEEQLRTLAGDLSHGRSLGLGSGALADSGFGGPQTLLLVGNDQRAHTTTAPVLPHSNEMLLVRFDPGKPWISMMSIPRELYVPITQPDGRTVSTRFNYAYTAGGIPLLVAEIRRILGLGVNHVVVIDFNQFKRAVDEMGCVYTTIDRRYYHVNTPTSEQYQEINLQPGLQRVCGTQALEYVSYRHGDTSLVRDARDQSFLLSAKQQYGPTLVDNAGKFERIFGSLVTTDPGLHTPTGVLNLLGTLVGSAGLPVRQVRFHVDLTPSAPGAVACQCVTATSGAIAAGVHSFLFGAVHRPPRVATGVVRRRGGVRTAARAPVAPGLAGTSAADLAAARAAARRLPFPLAFPAVRWVVGAPTVPAFRDYQIHGPGGVAHPAFAEVFDTGLLGQYYDVQGTTWTAAPNFRDPAQTVTAGHRRFALYYSGAHLVQVAWSSDHAVYWVHNSLGDSVANGELLAIAEQTDPVGVVGTGVAAGTGVATGASGATGSASGRRVVLHGVRAPAFVAPGSRVPLRVTLGSLAGLLSLLLLPVGLWSVRRRRRRLRVLRGAIEFAEAREERLERAIVSRSGPSRSTSPEPAPGRRSRAA